MAETWKEIAFAPELAHLQSDLREHDVQMVFVSYGDAKANRKLAEAHRLDGPFLLMKNASEALEAFRGMGTPAAYLLDKQGRVAQPLAVGADLVPGAYRAEPSSTPRACSRIRPNRLPTLCELTAVLPVTPSKPASTPL